MIRRAFDRYVNWLGRTLDRISRFVSPDRSAPWWVRAMPYATLVFAGLVVFIFAGAAWEITNSNLFCGSVCHTMPPEFISYQQSPHASVKCVECHIGRATIATQFTRKAHDISHVITYLGADYEMPIFVKSLRPAAEVCERCHTPEKFSPDSLRQIDRFDAAANNDQSTTYLSFKTGGGSHREGRGKGIHWHIENKIDYIATDDANLQQEIPWVQVTHADTGKIETFVDSEANLPEDFAEKNQDKIKSMDCVTCHNRIAHKFKSPAEAIDDLMARGEISAKIPYFKQNAVEVMERQYPTMDHAVNAIDGIKNYYLANWSDYYQNNQAEVDSAVDKAAAIYPEIVFPTMDASWTSHPDNIGHKDWAGCFRCHDGKHLNEQQESIRVECNLCHSIPQKAPADGSTPYLPITEAFEPESHIDTNWIARHRFEFDNSCQGCHDVSNPGGSDDSSFCANSACHATEWKYAGFNAPNIVAISNQLPEALPRYPESPLTWNDLVGPILGARCSSCHGGTAGLYLDSYAGAMAGGNLGPAIIPGNAEESLLIQLQQQGHPNSLPPEELDWINQWINAGAPEL